MPIVITGHFYVFAWERWEEGGGMHDLASSHTTFEDAKRAVDDLPTKPTSRFQIAFFAQDGSASVVATKQFEKWTVE